MVVEISSDFERPGAVRSVLQEQMNLMVAAGQLWTMFRAVINQALEGIAGECKGDMKRVMAAIDEKVAAFFVQSLQLNTFRLEMESTG
jgi:hypothetical protein